MSGFLNNLNYYLDSSDNIKHLIQRHFIAYETVTPDEIKQICKDRRMRALIVILSTLAYKSDEGYKWLITSINHDLQGNLRVEKDPRTHHRGFQGIDVTPVSKDDKGDYTKIKLPVPLNRNLVLMSLFDITARKMFRSLMKTIPFVGFESDHIHADTTRPGNVIAYLEVRPALDPVGRILGKRLKHLNTRKIKPVIEMYEVN